MSFVWYSECKHILDEIEYLVQILEVVPVGKLVDVGEQWRNKFNYLGLVIEEHVSGECE